MDSERLQALVSRFPLCRVVVLGDFFLDKYLDVDPVLAETSLETGRTAHQVVAVRCSPGAAGTVVNNLAALGTGRIHVLGVTGEDGEGYELRKALRALGCCTEGLQSVPGRFTSTYLKPRNCRERDLAGEHERYDTKNRQPMPVDVQRLLVSELEQLMPDVDAVIVLDQVEEEECGVITTGVCERIAGLAAEHPDKIFWADSRRRIGRFRKVMIKVNAAEAFGQTCAGAAPDVEASVRIAIRALRERNERPVFVTAGKRGVWISDPEPQLVPAVQVDEPTDPTGAGDSASAAAVLALCSGASLWEAALLANLVASITVQQLATTGTAHPAELVPRLALWNSQQTA